MRPRHFCEVDGTKVDFYRDFLVPFGKRYAAAVHKLHSGIFFKKTWKKWVVGLGPTPHPNNWWAGKRKIFQKVFFKVLKASFKGL